MGSSSKDPAVWAMRVVGVNPISQGGSQFNQIARSSCAQGHAHGKPLGAAQELAGDHEIKALALVGLAETLSPRGPKRWSWPRQ